MNQTRWPVVDWLIAAEATRSLVNECIFFSLIGWRVSPSVLVKLTPLGFQCWIMTRDIKCDPFQSYANGASLIDWVSSLISEFGTSCNLEPVHRLSFFFLSFFLPSHAVPRLKTSLGRANQYCCAFVLFVFCFVFYQKLPKDSHYYSYANCLLDLFKRSVTSRVFICT